jgi:hypothetical protein
MPARVPPLPLPDGPALLAVGARTYLSVAPAVNGQWGLLVSFAHYTVTAPLSRARRRGRAHDARSQATARAPGLLIVA